MEKQKNVPVLRFAEFRDEWKEKSIEESIDFLSGFPFEGVSITDDSNGIPLMRGVNITEGYIRHSAEIDKYYSGDISKLGKYFIKEGDLVIGMDGSKVGRNSSIIDSLNSGSILVQRVARLRQKETSSLLFIYQHINSYRFHKYVDEVKTSSGIPHISASHIKDFKISFPSLPEQTKIANFLTAIDTKIQQLTKKKALLEEYKKGVMQQLFSQTIRFKDENGADYPDWEEKKLGDIAKFSKGKGISKSEIAEDGVTKCIRYGELYTRYSEVINEVYSKTNADVKDLVLSEANDVIIPASGETQIDIATASCVINSGIALGGDLNIIKTKNNGVFLSYYLNNVKKMDIAILAQGISVVHLYSSQLALLSLSIPSIPEQNKITDFLTSIEYKIQAVNKQIEQTQAYKKGLLQQLFI